MIRTNLLASIACLLICRQASAIDKGTLLSTYRDKFVVARKDGLGTLLHQGLSAGTWKYLIDESGKAEGPKLIGGDANGVSSFAGGPKGPGAGLNAPWRTAPRTRQTGCGIVQIRKGGVVKVSHVSLSGRHLDIDLTVSPQAVQCAGWTDPPGPRAPAEEMGSTELSILVSKSAGLDMDALAALAAQWLTPFDKADDAATFANTLNQVKLGMIAADVENAIGKPQTRVDSNGKILYKYKNMTVEFEDGKVTDVR